MPVAGRCLCPDPQDSTAALIVLMDEQKQPGGFTATWDASGMASGMDVYRLTAGNRVECRKMLWMKRLRFRKGKFLLEILRTRYQMISRNLAAYVRPTLTFAPSFSVATNPPSPSPAR